MDNFGSVESVDLRPRETEVQERVSTEESRPRPNGTCFASEAKGKRITRWRLRFTNFRVKSSRQVRAKNKSTRSKSWVRERWLG